MSEPGSRDPPPLAVWRLALELAAWVVLWLAWGMGAVGLAVLALSLFNTPGDKRVVIVAVPGPVRLLVEVAVELAGVYAAYRLWGWLAVGFLLVYVLHLIAAHERLRWLLTGRG
ncbi:MAG: hypothetical protein HY335_01060 [Deinococcus sp.]|nr:hypothetical protein [Deinococcus sp.]